MKRVSRRVVPGPEHPLQRAMEQLVQSGDMPDIHKKVYELAKKHKKTPSLVDARLVAECKENGIYDNIRAKVVAFLAAEKEARKARTDVQPPKSHRLYERVDKDKVVVDFGCGDGKRIGRYREHFREVKMVDSREETLVFEPPPKWSYVVTEEIPKSDVVVSFNVLSQLKEEKLEEVLNRDGLHIVPKVLKFAHVGLSRDVGGGWYETKVGNSVFLERETGLEGEDEGFYVLYNSYEAEDVEFISDGRCSGQFSVRSKMKRMTNWIGGTPTYKYDGEFVRLRGNSGRFSCLGRNGEGVTGVYKGKDVDLELEHLGDRVVLLRVNEWNGYRPFHSLRGLRDFVSKKKPILDGIHIEAPVPARPFSELPAWADGFVFRDKDIDYVVGDGIGIDLEGRDVVKLEEYMINSRCMRSVTYEGPRDGFVEVRVKEGDEGICTMKGRYRSDKTKADVDWDEKFKLMTVSQWKLGFETEDERSEEFEAEEGGED